MDFSANYTDCRAFISCAESGMIAEVTIVFHNKEYMTISVQGPFQEAVGNEVVTVLILTDDGLVHEFCGRIRHSTTDPTRAEISLFRGHQKEDRNSKRYIVNTPALVENLITPEGKRPLNRAVEVVLTNLSTAGVMFTAPPNSFTLNSVVEIKLKVNTSIKAMQGRIVRVRNLDNACTEYGCELVAAY